MGKLEEGAGLGAYDLKLFDRAEAEGENRYDLLR
jgi:hypothetical protein